MRRNQIVPRVHRLLHRNPFPYVLRMYEENQEDGVMSDPRQERYMRRAIELAANVPDLPFAALIVDPETGSVLAEGWNKSSVNPTWHGEIDAINSLATAGTAIEGRSLVLYTTAEPCPMCQGRSFGPESRRLSSARPSVRCNDWAGGRSTFWPKRWFGAAQGGTVSSSEAYLNRSATVCLNWRCHEAAGKPDEASSIDDHT